MLKSAFHLESIQQIKKSCHIHFKDKELIKSHIKYLPKGKKFGIANDFPKEIDAIRKKLYPVMKKAKKDQKKAFFNVGKLIIDKIVYRGPETKEMPLYDRIMGSTQFKTIIEYYFECAPLANNICQVYLSEPIKDIFSFLFFSSARPL